MGIFGRKREVPTVEMHSGQKEGENPTEYMNRIETEGYKAKQQGWGRMRLFKELKGATSKERQEILKNRTKYLQEKLENTTNPEEQQELLNNIEAAKLYKQLQSKTLSYRKRQKINKEIADLYEEIKGPAGSKSPGGKMSGEEIQKHYPGP